MSDWIVAVALVLVIEGLMPFLSPGAWRDTMRRVAELSDGQLRFIGLGSMVLGLVILVVAR